MPQPLCDQDLIGRPGGRLALTTPALVLDLAALEANIAAMTAWAAAQGIALRPHAKTHKCAAIGRRQMAAGALGLCCAKLSEAEALAGALAEVETGAGDNTRLDRFLLTAPVVGARRIDRLMTLAAAAEEVMVVADDRANVAALGAAATAAGRSLGVLIDVDIGQGRTGVTDADSALALADAIAAQAPLTFKGVQGYAGQVQHIAGFAERRAASHAALARLGAVRDALQAAGHACPVVTGGGTGSHAIDPDAGVLTELQVGSYIVSDVEYDAVDLTGAPTRPFRNALFVYTRVISACHAATAGFVTIDAGSKSLAMDGPAPVVAFGAAPETVYTCVGDEFGRLTLPPGHPAPRPGDLVGLVVPHCDPTINLFDAYHCIRGDDLADIWPIEARGCSA